MNRLFLPLLLAGCVTPDLQPRFTPAWEPVNRSEAGWISTRKALLIADCQIHNLYSQPLPERNLSAETVAATAIRPPQLDLFSGDVLAWVLSHGAPDADVVLHLGDALDLACTGELDTFLDVMARSTKPWFMAPGNHDFFYFGTYDPQDRALWEDASYGGGKPLPKDEFIRLYVRALLRQDEPGCAALAAELGGRDLPDTFEWSAPENTPGFLKAIAWKIDPERPWRSFILQEIDMTRPGEEWAVRVYLLDSCQYQRRPVLIPNAWKSYPLRLNCGFTGEMLPDQLRTLRKWVEARTGQSSVLACHHPFDSLAPRTKSSLGWLWRERRSAMMLTAHTHEGYYVHHDLGGDFDEIELNLGSTTDWPMEWRTLMGIANPTMKRSYICADRFTLVDTLVKQGGYFELGWEVPLNAPDDYRRYKQGRAANSLLVDFYLAHHVTPYWMSQPKIRPNEAARETEGQVKDTLLWTYARLIETFPTEPSDPAPRWPEGCGSDSEVVEEIRVVAADPVINRKIALLQQLSAFECSRKTADDDARARFKISQAAWASRFEASQGRRLRVEDELIRVDWEKAMRYRDGK